MGMVTELETALCALMEPLRATRFSAILENSRRSEPDVSLPHPSPAMLNVETSFDPAIQRTFVAIPAHRMLTGHDLPEDEWTRWNADALRAAARVAAKCWSGIDRDVRIALLDEDNLPLMWTRDYVTGLRN